MRKLLLYIHGKGGSADEAEHYKALCAGYDVIGLDYKSATPWAAKDEFMKEYRRLAAGYDSVGIITNSIGAYLAMNTLSSATIERAYFISPIVDMEKLIADMLLWAGATEDELAQKKEITTAFGETLSWEYLCYVRAHPLDWQVPTAVLYGENDNLTAFDTIADFAERHHAALTVMPGGEHWFHTKEQMDFLDDWLIQRLKKEK